MTDDNTTDALTVLINAFIERDGFGFTYARIWQALHGFDRPLKATPEPIFPSMPPSVVTHPKLGPMWDRLAMQFYAVSFSAKVLDETRVRNAPNAQRLSCGLCGGSGAQVGCDACRSTGSIGFKELPANGVQS
jgi:hypothetical protein